MVVRSKTAASTNQNIQVSPVNSEIADNAGIFTSSAVIIPMTVHSPPKVVKRVAPIPIIEPPCHLFAEPIPVPGTAHLFYSLIPI